MSKTIRKNIRDDITSQVIDEIQHARTHKRGIIREWQKNEDIINEKQSNISSARSLSSKVSDFTRSNVALHKATGFIQTVLSKIDTPLSFEFTHQHEGDMKNAKLLNALVDVDQERDNWNYKDLLGKEQAITYGRAIFSYQASSTDGYEPKLTNIDVYDFLIDPNAGGLDMQNARYCGAYNIRMDRKDIEEGIKDGRYLKTEAQEILSGTGNNDEKTQEENDKTNRYLDFGSRNSDREKNDPDLFKFWNWYTTYKGDRYYVVVSETHGTPIRIEKLSDITDSDLFPFWSYAVFPSLTEFWSRSYIGVVREVFMAQNVSINQMLDNADKINNPQRAVDVQALLDESELRYKKNGKIRFKGGTNVNQALQVLETPNINTPIEVYETLENIVQLASGVTNAVQGAAEEDKVGIYEGNISATSDRFNLLNKSYSNGYKHFSQLYKWGVQEHLKQRQAVKIIGPAGVEISNINYKDVKPLADYMVAVNSSTAESQADFRDKREKLEFLGQYIGVGVINDVNAFEMEAEIVGFDASDIRRLTDSKNTYKTEVISEAARDIEYAIKGKDMFPNEIADQSYLEYVLRYFRDKKENLNEKQQQAVMNLYEINKDVAVRNMVMNVQDEIAEAGGLPEEGLQELGGEVEPQPEFPGQTPQQQLQDAPPQQQLAGDQLQSQFGQQQL
ncbi:hypothetical protein N8148_02795 [Gammaproteobacteria bacterium]|nr:hypothetical protein [Gammaproteobacteria bacterium]